MFPRSFLSTLCLVAGACFGRALSPRSKKLAPAKQPPAKESPALPERDLFDGKTLSGWKVTDFGGQGKVYVQQGAIVMEMGNEMTGITWTGKPPRSNYELSLEGRRLEGHDFFCTTTFPVGKDYCSLVMGGWAGTVVGLSNVDFADASENATTQFRQFKDKQWYRVRIRVTDAKIEAWIDDKPVVQQERQGPQVRHPQRSGHEPPAGHLNRVDEGRGAEHQAAGVAGKIATIDDCHSASAILSDTRTRPLRNYLKSSPLPLGEGQGVRASWSASQK